MSNEEKMEGGGNKSKDSGDNKVSFEEKELEILRDAVAEPQSLTSFRKMPSFTIPPSSFLITIFIQITHSTMQKNSPIFIIRQVMKM
jgi:hypothetical protein